MIPTFEFYEKDIIKRRDLFPDEISNNDWIVYHGTSSVNEKYIDQEGLIWKDNKYTKYNIQQIINIYESINWNGIDQGGYLVLKSFTYNYDFKDSISKPIFLAETSLRALLYATKDFAGGETSRAIRKSINDLKLFINSPALRLEHEKDLERDYNQLLKYGNKINKPNQINLSNFRNELKKIEFLHQDNESLYNSHDYGLIYAIKINKADVTFLEKNSMGIISNKPIKADQLIAKIKIPKNFEYKNVPDQKKIKILLNPTGLFKELVNKTKLLY